MYQLLDLRLTLLLVDWLFKIQFIYSFNRHCYTRYILNIILNYENNKEDCERLGITRMNPCERVNNMFAAGQWYLLSPCSFSPVLYPCPGAHGGTLKF